MSIGLAMQKIGFWTGKYDFYSGEVNRLQMELMVIGLRSGLPGQSGIPSDQATANIRRQLAVYMFLQGMAKEFVDYWKQVVKDFLSMLKSLQELAQGAR